MSQYVIILLVLYAISLVVLNSITPISSYLNFELGRKITLHAQMGLFEQAIRLNQLEFFEQPGFHRLFNVAVQGCTSGPSQVLNIFVILVRSTLSITGFIAISASLSPYLAIILVIVTLLQLRWQLRLSKQRVDLAFMNSSKDNETRYISQILTNSFFLKEVFVLSLSKHFLQRFRQLTTEVMGANQRLQLRETAVQVVLGTISSLGATLGFAIVIWAALVGRITIGTVTFYAGALSAILGGLAAILNTLVTLNESSLYFNHFLTLESAINDRLLHNGSIQIEPLSEAIEFRHVSFRYSQDSAWILRDLNLSLPKGSCTAIIGLNGSGKSTLVKLLTRLYDPTDGQILWDGIDIREIRLDELRKRTAVLFQDFIKYDFTAKDNIGLGDVNYIEDLDRISKAARDVNINRVLELLPNAYDTRLSLWLGQADHGTTLSGGEWQKVALARMMMRQSDVLLLDEPTAALDATAEDELLSKLRAIINGRTTVLITHRLTNTRIADIIAVLGDGHITEYGSHDDLMALGGQYASMFRSQTDVQPLQNN